MATNKPLITVFQMSVAQKSSNDCEFSSFPLQSGQRSGSATEQQPRNCQRFSVLLREDSTVAQPYGDLCKYHMTGEPTIKVFLWPPGPGL